MSVFSACFWPEWRANNCQGGNVRASGTFIPLILHSQLFTQMQPSKARFKLYMVLSICGVGRKFCGGKVLLEAQFVKVPFYYGSFPPPLPQIDPSAQHHPEWDLNYILWKEEQKISFLSLPISGWILTLGWQFGANPTEFEQNAKFRPIPGHNGQVGYKSE